jgi:hypothetical protein
MTGGPRRVVFDVDTRAYLESEEQLDGVVRELQLLALSPAATSVRDEAGRLLPIVKGFMNGFAHIRLNNRVQAQTAARHREPTVRLVMTLVPEAAGVARAFVQLLDELDAYWRDWGLLAWAQTEETRAVREGMLHAIVTQLDAARCDR